MRVDQVTGELTVGQLASRAGVRTDTIRYYEREGLLPVPQRTEGEHRRYGEADVDWLLFIRGAQRLGLRVAQIRDLLAVRDTGACPCGPASDLLRRHVSQIEETSGGCQRCGTSCTACYRLCRARTVLIHCPEPGALPDTG